MNTYAMSVTDEMYSDLLEYIENKKLDKSLGNIWYKYELKSEVYRDRVLSINFQSTVMENDSDPFSLAILSLGVLSLGVLSLRVEVVDGESFDMERFTLSGKIDEAKEEQRKLVDSIFGSMTL